MRAMTMTARASHPHYRPGSVGSFREVPVFLKKNWIGMGQHASTQPCVTGLRRSVCTTFVLGDENGYNANNKKVCKV